MRTVSVNTTFAPRFLHCTDTPSSATTRPNAISGFRINFVSRPDRESLIVEILYRSQRLCEIDRERGVDSMRIFFVDDVFVLPQHVEMMFSLSEFLTVVDRARALLKEVPPETQEDARPHDEANS